MPTTSASDARRRFLRSLPWLALSLSAAVELQQRRADLRASLEQAQAALDPLQARARAIAQLGAPEAPLPGLADTVVAALDVLRGAEVRQGVKVESLALPGRAPAGAEGPPDGVALARMAQPMRGVPGLRTLRLDVRASYQSYAGLQQWLAALGSLPLSLRRVWLEEQHVQLVVELVGA